MLVLLDGHPGPGEADTVIDWRRAGFRLCCRWRSRPLGGRPKIADEIRVVRINRVRHRREVYR